MASSSNSLSSDGLIRQAEELMFAGHYSSALERLEQALELDPSNLTTRHYLIRCCLAEEEADLMPKAAQHLSYILLHRGGS